MPGHFYSRFIRIEMASSPPLVLILGHSFVRRLKEDLQSNFDVRADKNFGLAGDAIIHMHGVGGRTVKKLRDHDLGVISSWKPHAVILEIGTNDLADLGPEVVGSEIEELTKVLLGSFSVKVIGVCQVIPRFRAPFFNASARILNQYLTEVLEDNINVFCWEHSGFTEPSVSPYLADGVHLNSLGQYKLYRSYRGAILKAIRNWKPSGDP